MNEFTRSSLAAIHLAAVLTACGAGGGADDGADETGGSGGPPCHEPIPWAVASVDDFRNVSSGVAEPAALGLNDGWTSLAYGHVDDPADHASCCLDYAVASDVDSTIYVYLGAASNGLVVLEEGPPITRDTGGDAVLDVALADVTGDNRSDLAALTDNSEVFVWQGQARAPYLRGVPVVVTAAFGGAVATHQLAVADVSCDQIDDVIVTSDLGVISLRQGRDVLSRKSSHAMGAAVRSVALGDIDGDGDADVVATTEIGDIRVADQIGCPVFQDPPDVYPVGLGGGFTPNPGDLPVTLGNVCPDFPNAKAIVWRHHDHVRALCGDGTGTFANVLATYQSGSELDVGIDYDWLIPSTLGTVATFGSHSEVFVSSNWRLVPGVCGPETGWRLPLTQPGGGGSKILLQPEQLGDTEWDRALIVSGDGFVVHY